MSRSTPPSLYLSLAEVVGEKCGKGRTEVTRTIETTDESGILVPLPRY